MAPPPVTRADFFTASRRIEKRRQTQARPVGRTHDFPRLLHTPDSHIPCDKCGITYREFCRRPVADQPCKGDAYICRVMRVLNKGRGKYSLVWHIRPWRMTPAVFWAQIRSVVNSAIGVEWPERVTGLVRAIRTTPHTLPVLADALEEAGCEDAELLAALRTP